MTSLPKAPARQPSFTGLDDTDLVGDLVLHSAQRWPDRVALACGDERVTYADVVRRARRIAGLLAARGVRPGDRVILVADNRVDFVAAYFGILFSGGVVVPLNPLLKASEMAHVIENSGAAVFVTIPDRDGLSCASFAAAAISGCGGEVELVVIGGPAWEGAQLGGVAPEPVRVSAEDLAVIIYTSGTTGRPRGAELRHRNVRDNAVVGGRLFDCDAARPDVTLCALPLFHSFGQSGMQNTTLAFGGTLVLVDRFEASAVLELMREHGVTYFGGVPTMFWRLVETASPDDTEQLELRVALSGGAALPVQLHRDFESRFGITIIEGYGLSETSPLACTCRIGEPVREGSIGRPVPGVEMRLLEPGGNAEIDEVDGVGEIAVRGHNVMRGYHGLPEATAAVFEDGWLRTGDLARRDSDGFYYIVDRLKDLVIRGGYNVYPREVEEILMTHPDVSLVAVVGVPHLEHGEEIKAVVVPRPGRVIEPGSLRAWAREQMAAYKYPRIVEVRNSLPLGPTGKILKREL